MTNGIQNLIEKNKIGLENIADSMRRFAHDDFGLVCEETNKLQQDLIKENKLNYNFMGVYEDRNSKIKYWLIQGLDSSVGGLYTTVLLPDEY